MKRIRLQHQYHDASLKSVKFNDPDVTLVADLDGHWNNKRAERAYLTFHSVKNIAEVRATLSARPDEDVMEVNDEMIGVVKLDKTRYLVDLHRVGSLVLDCRGISEI